MPVDPEGFGAHDAFELATIRGAEAIGKGAEIGSLEAGKLADVVVFDCGASALTPRGDVALQLVWGSDGRDVRDVFIGGTPRGAPGTLRRQLTWPTSATPQQTAQRATCCGAPGSRCRTRGRRCPPAEPVVHEA